MARKCLIILLLLCGAASASTSRSYEMIPEDYADACEYTYVFHGADCEDLAAPRVLYSEFRSRITGQPNLYLYGRYWHGSNYVEININIPEEQARKTTLHEAVHYILHFKAPEIGRCEGEEIARRATAAIFGDEYTDDWKEWYRC